MEEMSKLGWLITLVKYVRVYPVPVVTFNFHNPNLFTAFPMTLLHYLLSPCPSDTGSVFTITIKKKEKRERKERAEQGKNT
jgi:hypothetical protein